MDNPALALPWRPSAARPALPWRPSAARPAVLWRRPDAALAFAGTVVPFAKSWARLRSMTNGRRQTKAILKAIARGEDRSSLFWWMVEHHDEILAAAEGRRIQWGTFCAEATRLGLTDTKGKPPTTRNARETWRQARRAVEEARERTMAKGPSTAGEQIPLADLPGLAAPGRRAAPPGGRSRPSGVLFAGSAQRGVLG
jgi:hypothetical protein